MNLTKQQAIDVFGSGAALGRALGLTRGRISQWAATLDQKQTDMVVGAAIRLGKQLPDEFASAPPRVADPDTTQAEPAAA